MFFYRNPLKWINVKTLTSYDTVPADAEPNKDYFGTDMSYCKSNNLLAVGAYGDEENGGNRAGSVSIFKYENEDFAFVQQITASGDLDPAGDRFGYKVSFAEDGQMLFVSAHYDEESGINAGAVYVFQSSSLGYQQIQKITASGDSSPQYDRFGTQVLTNGNGQLLFIAAGSDEEPGPESTDLFNTGSVYVFQSGSSGYERVQKILLPDDYVQTDNSSPSFPSDMKYCEQKDLLFLGAAYEESTRGSVRIYASGSNGYEPIQKITPLGAQEGEPYTFGSSLAITKDGTKLAVGAPVDCYGDNLAYGSAGSAFIFESSSLGYQQVQKLELNLDTDVTAFNFANFINFSDNGNILFVSVPKQLGTKCIYVYESGSNGYQKIDEIEDHRVLPGTSSAFGYRLQTIDQNGDLLVTSDYRNNFHDTNDGAVYLFKKTRDY